MKNIYKIVLGIAGTGAIVSTGVITANKIIDNKGENKMSNTVEVISELNVNEQDDKNIIENQVEQVENVTEETPETDNQVKESMPKVNQAVPIQNEQVTDSSEPAIEQEKEVICTINVKEYAEGQHWKEGVPQKIELKLGGSTVYQNYNVLDFNSNITINIKGKGTETLFLIINGGGVLAISVNFDTQTNITIP